MLPKLKLTRIMRIYKLYWNHLKVLRYSVVVGVFFLAGMIKQKIVKFLRFFVMVAFAARLKIINRQP